MIFSQFFLFLLVSPYAFAISQRTLASRVAKANENPQTESDITDNKLEEGENEIYVEENQDISIKRAPAPPPKPKKKKQKAAPLPPIQFHFNIPRAESRSQSGEKKEVVSEIEQKFIKSSRCGSSSPKVMKRAAEEISESILEKADQLYFQMNPEEVLGGWGQGRSQHQPMAMGLVSPEQLEYEGQSHSSASTANVMIIVIGVMFLLGIMK